MEKKKMRSSKFSRLVFLTLYCALSCAVRVSAQEDKQIAFAGAAQGVVNSPATIRSVSLPDCFNLADHHNQEILSASWNLTIAQAAIKIAAAVPNPQLALQTGFGNSFQYLFDGQTQDFYITQQFQTAGKRSKKMEVARANYGLAELQLDALRFSVHNRVRRAYAELAAAEAFEALVESQRQVGLRLLDIAKKRNAAGKAPMAEVLQANLNVLQFDTQRNQAQGRLQQDSALLTQIIGEKPEHVEVIDVDDNGIFKLSAQKTDIVPQATRETPRLDALINTAFRYRPDLKAAVQQVYANEKAVTLARTKKIPDLFIGIGGTYSTFTRNQPAGLNAVGNWIGTGIFMNVTAEAPLFYQYQGEVQQALGIVRQSQRQVELLRSQIATDTVTAYNEASVARENIIEFQKNQLPTAAEVAKLARRSYEVGQSDLTSAIIAQQQYQQTLSNYFNAVVTYQTAWADLEKAVGAPLKMQ
jgi:cobalt-zinc-cadmium efflux system outer membrane protein